MSTKRSKYKSRSKPSSPRSGRGSPTSRERYINSDGVTKSDMDIDNNSDKKVTLTKRSGRKTSTAGEKSTVQVAVRVRPMSVREVSKNYNIAVNVSQNTIEICNPRDGTYKQFTFDHSYPSESTQEQVYSDIGDSVVHNAFEGYNCCILAYGQTGSGKTHTMLGYDSKVNDCCADNDGGEGMIPRIARALLAMAAQKKKADDDAWDYHFEISYMEIYAEKAYDLMVSQREPLRIRHHEKRGTYVENLKKLAVTGYDDMKRFMDKGNNHRTTASTELNDHSSRSHAIFCITFKQYFYVGGERKKTKEKTSTIYLVDLAGSERVEVSGVTGVGLQEAISINKSLVTLGLVITKLVKNQKAGSKDHIPFRDSTLTWILSDAIGGNSKTFMIATISPVDGNYNESLNTLRYADNAKKIINSVSVNEDIDNDLIVALQAEIESLRGKLSEQQESMLPPSVSLQSIEDEIAMRTTMLAELQKSWEQQLVETKEVNASLITDLETEHNTVKQLNKDKEDLKDELARVIAERELTITGIREQTRLEIEQVILKQMDEIKEDYQSQLQDAERSIDDIRRKMTRIEEESIAKSRAVDRLTSELADAQEKATDIIIYKEKKQRAEERTVLAEAEIHILQKQIDDLEKSATAHSSLFDSTQKEINVYRGLYEDAIRDRKDAEAMETKIVQHQALISKLESRAFMQQDTITSMQSQLDSKERFVQDLTMDLNNERQLTDQTNNDLASLEQNFNDIKEQLQTAKQDLGSIKEQLQISEQEKQNTINKLQTAEQDLGFVKEQLQTAKQEEQNTINKLQTAEQEKQKSESRVTELKQELYGARDQIMLVEQDLSNTKDQIIIGEQEKQELERELNDIKNQLMIIEQEKGELKTILDLKEQDLTTQCGIWEQDNQELKDQLAIMEQEARDMKDQVTIIEREKQDLTNQMTLAEQDRQDFLNQIDEEDIKQQQNTELLNSRMLELASVQQKNIELETQLATERKAMMEARDQINTYEAKLMTHEQSSTDMENIVQDLQNRLSALVTMNNTDTTQSQQHINQQQTHNIDSKDLAIQLSTLEERMKSTCRENLSVKEALNNANKDIISMRNILDEIKTNYSNIYLDLQGKNSTLSDRERELLGEKIKNATLSKARLKQLQMLMHLAKSLKDIEQQVVKDTAANIQI